MKAQSEQKTAEGILNQFEPNSEYPQYYHEGDVLKAMEEYGSQFKSQLPIEQKNELELIIAEKNIDIIHLRDRIKELESQPLPIEQKPEPNCLTGEKCHCGKDAVKKITEVILPHENQVRHEFTQYVCQKHFDLALRPYLFKNALAQSLPIEGVERYTVEDMKDAFQSGIKKYFAGMPVFFLESDFKEWLATRKGSTSGE